MLFKKDGKGFQFCLINLSNAEYFEIGKLIEDNGGVISISQNFPVMLFANDDINDSKKPVFHVKYIRECVKQGKLLDLIDFILGPKGFYGCLMNIFVNHTRRCTYAKECCGCQWSARFISKTKSSPSISSEHNYAQGDINKNSEELMCSIDVFDSRFNDRHSIPKMAERKVASEIPEPSRFEELDTDVNYPRPEVIQEANVTEQCSPRNVGMKEAEISANIDADRSSSAAEKEKANVRSLKKQKAEYRSTVICDKSEDIKIIVNSKRMSEIIKNLMDSSDSEETGMEDNVSSDDSRSSEPQPGPSGTIPQTIIISDSSSAEVEDEEPADKNKSFQKKQKPVVFSRNFMPWERKEMVEYLIKKNTISKARGITVWKRFIAAGFLTHRTPQSLNNHFRKSILPYIHRYTMSNKNMQAFKKLGPGPRK